MTTLEYSLDPSGLRIAGIDGTNPVIYDNDWWRDVTDQFYLWAQADSGRANLRGHVVTRDLWNWWKGYHFQIEQSFADAQAALAIARRSGFNDLPEPTLGCNLPFAPPTSGRIEDTQPIASAGSELIVAEANKATADTPLVVFVGGPLNSVANAYLLHPSIAERIVVFMTDLRGYNGKDPWANYIVAKRCRLVNFGAKLWWPQRPLPPVMPPERFDTLQQNELVTEMRRIAQMFWDRSTRREKPDRDDGFGDGAPVFLFFDPLTWTSVQRQRVCGVFDVEDTDGDEFDLLDARSCDYGRMSRNFFAAFASS